MSARQSAAAEKRPAWLLLAALVPALFAIPVLLGIAKSTWRLIHTARPDLAGVGSGIATDAAALFYGQTIYQDPAEGYAGMVYTPLYSATASVLDRIVYWPGWLPFITISATLVLSGLAAWLAFRPAGPGLARRAVAVLEAIGVGAVAWWLVGYVPAHFLYSARPDHLAWMLAFAGLILLPRAAHGSRVAQVAVVLLLSAAFWTKQTAVIASFAAVAWLAIALALRLTSWRTALVLAGVLGTLNLAILGLLNLATDGWEYKLSFSIPGEQPKTGETLGFRIQTLYRDTTEPFLFAAALWLAVAVRAFGGRLWRFVARARKGPVSVTVDLSSRRTPSETAQVAAALGLFLLIAVPAVLYMTAYIGATNNHFVALAWPLALLAAIAYRAAGGTREGIVVRAAAVALLGLAALQGVSGRDFRSAVQEWPAVPAEIADYAEAHPVYHPRWGDTIAYAGPDVEDPGFYPVLDNFQTFLAVGRQPGYVVPALLERRFDAVAQFFPGDSVAMSVVNTQISARGRWEDNFLWKLNRVMEVKYQPSDTVPAGMLSPRPGLDPAPWMEHCFGPFDISGFEIRIGQGGGFWCTGKEPGVLTLRDTPAETSELRLIGTGELGFGGGISLRIPHPESYAELLFQKSGQLWRVRAERGRDGRVTIESSDATHPLDSLEIRVPPRVPVRFALVGRAEDNVSLTMTRRAGQEVGLALPTLAGPPWALNLVATRESEAAMDLSELRPGAP